MLGRLIKYEFKSTIRIFPMLFAGLIVLATVNRFIYGGFFDAVSRFEFDWVMTLITGISTFLYGLLIASTVISLISVTIQRFRGNLLGSEGYLMFTLPVSSEQLILSKMVVMAVWGFLSAFFVALSAMIVSTADILVILEEISKGISEFIEFAGPLAFVELILLMLIGIISYTLPIFTSIAIGSLWRRHRTLGSFLAFIGLSTLAQAISGTVMFKIAENRPYLDYANATQADFLAYQRAEMQAFIIPTLIITTLFAVAFFFITTTILNKKLDIE